MNAIQVVDFKPEYQPAFENFNRDWIEEHYDLEPIDLFVLTKPREAIIDPGGAILVALYNGEAAGVLALRKVNEDVYEYTKMAVSRNFRRKGIGEALSVASFEKARSMGAKKLILYSNTLQADAIRLYERLGFRHLPVEKGVYERANVKMEIMLVQVNTTNKNPIK